MARKIPFLFLFLVLLARVSFAGYISLNTTVVSKVAGNTLEVAVTVVNKGDESAYGVQAEVTVAGKKFLAEKVPELGVDRVYKVSKNIVLSLKEAGQYPLIVAMHYADANQYPFSALTAQTFYYRSEQLPARVFGRMRSAAFWKRGRVGLTLKNLGETEIVGASHLIVPRELSVVKDSYKLKIPPKSERKLNFVVENFSALAGSTYQVFAVSEFVADGLHHTDITPGTIKIVERKNILGIDYVYLAVVLAGLILLFVGFQIFKK